MTVFCLVAPAASPAIGAIQYEVGRTTARKTVDALKADGLVESVRGWGTFVRLEVLLRAATEDTELHGWAIMKATKRSGPTVYGVLDRLEDMGWITGQWEDQNPKPNKPRRRFYRITPTGTVESRQVLTERRPQALRRERRTMPGWVYALRPGDVA